MAITRNASESLEICIFGLDLKPGDEVLTTNQDYGRMITRGSSASAATASSLSSSHSPFLLRQWMILYQRFERELLPKPKSFLFVTSPTSPGRFSRSNESATTRHRGRGDRRRRTRVCPLPVQARDLDCDYYGRACTNGCLLRTAPVFYTSGERRSSSVAAEPATRTRHS